MSELSPTKGPDYYPAARESFEQRTKTIQESLMALATKNVEARYNKQLSYYKQKYEQLNRQSEGLRRQIEGLKKNSLNSARIQKKQMEIQKRQQQANERDKRLIQQVNLKSKEAEILRLQLKLKQDLYNQTLINEHELVKNKLEHDLREVKNQLQMRVGQAQVMKSDKAMLEKRLKLMQDELDDTKVKLKTLQESNEVELKNREQDYKRLDGRYELQMKEWQQANKVNYAALIAEKQGTIKDLKGSLQSQRLSFEKKWQQLNKKVSQIETINTKQSSQITILRQQQRSISQQYRKALKLQQQSQRKYEERIQAEKNKLQAHFQHQINTFFESTSQQLSKEVEGIKRQQAKLLAKKQQQNSAEIFKLQTVFHQERQQNSRVVANLKGQIEDIKRDQKNRRQQENQKSSQKIKQLNKVIGNLSNIVLNKSFFVADHSALQEAVREKVNLFNTQIDQLKGDKSILQQINEHLQLHAKQVRQWFRNISALLNSTQAATVLEKGQKYEIGDEDVLDSINSFTAKLQSRLSKHKIKEERLEQQIGKLGQQIKQRKRAKDEVDRTAAGLSDKVQFLEEQIRKHTSERQSTQRSIKQSSSTISRLQMQIKELQSSLAQKSADVISLREQISTLQNVKIVAYANRINQQVAKSQDISAKLSKVQNIVASLQVQKRALSQNLADRKAENDQRIRKLQELKQQMAERQRKWITQKESEVARFRGVINELFDNPAVDNTFDAMLNYIKDHKSGSQVGPFVVSTIFQTAPKERALLEGMVCKFMQYKSIKTTFLYKYDEFNKNFANYLPIKSNYDFVLLAKTKKSQIFGVISIGLGPKSRAMAFNLNSGKTFTGDASMSSTTYDGNYLLFGQSEIRIKNNSILELVVTTRIFGTRYFSFMKEELVGTENGESVLLDALEIHRIDY